MKNVNCKELKELNLSDNSLSDSDLNLLEKVWFDKLEKLNLSNVGMI